MSDRNAAEVIEMLEEIGYNELAELRSLALSLAQNQKNKVERMLDELSYHDLVSILSHPERR